MPTNNFLPFASASGALVISDASYAADAARLGGFQNGIADPARLNKVWRQGAAGSAVFGQMIVDHLAIDAVDDGNIANFKETVRRALANMLAGIYFGEDTSQTANVLTVALSPQQVILSAFRSIYVRVNNTNTGPVTLALDALGSRPVTRHDGSPLIAGDLPKGQIVQIFYDKTAGQYVLAGLGAAEVPRIVATPTVFVRPDGNDINDGSSNDSAHALATIAGAFAASRRFILSGTTLTIQLGQSGATYPLPPVLPALAGNVLIQGDPNNPAGYVLSGAGPAGGGRAVFEAAGTRLALNGLTVSNTSMANHTVAATGSGSLSLTNTVMTCTQAGNSASHTFAGSGGSVTLNAGNVYASSMTYMLAALGGYITAGAVQIAVQNTPTFSGATAFAQDCGVITFISGASFSGNASGVRYNAAANGIVRTAVGGVNFIPGSAAGTTSFGGLYF